MNRFLLVISFALMTNIIYCQTKNFIDQAYLETTAKADTLVMPDKIFLSIIISENNTKGKETLEDVELRMFEKLKLIGIETEKQLVLSDLSSNFKKYLLKAQDILKSKYYELLVFDAKTAGKVIYELEEIGISNVNFERTEYSKIEELQIKLKSKAIQKAKMQAEAMVKPLNQNLGKAIFISDINNTQIGNHLQGKVSGIRIRGSSSINKGYNVIPIEFEKIKVESEVNVKFIIH
ncbi:MAG: SIMPL domain-containing protein [Bacteroidales bacterium]|nr:SIMPL domain-containing protein [Bacteroidales bacterium]MBN2757333.1 SIMPL domain-containing protein [Bacteroidales bacterium]